ncbi:MAG: IS256 family transposase [Ilumatobacteraceae bacterium]
MTNDNVSKLVQPGAFEDPLTEILRNGARALLAQAVEAEVAAFLDKHADLKTEDGRQRIVRHGHLPEREVMTGIGPVGVRQPRVRDRGAPAEAAERIRFTSAILPPYARRSKSLDVLLPILYLKGISTGDFEEALAALLGKDAPGLSASTISRLKEAWVDEHNRWKRRDLSARRYVYVWADGIYLQARLEDEKQCILVLIGATPEGKKELIGFTDGARESAQDWRELLLDLKRRGLATVPKLAVADGGLGFWKALGEVWPTTREQRCWVHKTANVLNKLPKSQQPKAKRSLQEIWMAETRTDAMAAFDAFIESYRLKYEKAADCLAKDRDALLAFYDFPAEHWKHLRTSNPIESTFATVRHRTIRSKGCLSNATALAMVFKLVDAAQKSWRRLDGHNQLPKVVLGAMFKDGLEVAQAADYHPKAAA